MGGRCAVLLDWWVGGVMGAGRAVKIFLHAHRDGTRALFTWPHAAIR